jgi:hypothetical protein
MMRFARPILMAVLVAALAAYALDCGAMTSPEQAAQCCSSMPCSPRGHSGQDCCKSMPSLHAPFVQSMAVHGDSLAHIVGAASAPFYEFASTLPELGSTPAPYHGTPVLGPPALSHLRI